MRGGSWKHDRGCSAVASLVIVLLLSLACQGQRTEPNDQAAVAADLALPSPSPTEAAAASGPEEAMDHVVVGTADWADYYKSLAELVRVERIILVGRVTGVLLPCDNRPGYLGQPTPDIDYSDCPPDPLEAVPLHPELKHCLLPTPSPEELSRPPGRSFSVYSVEVQRVIASGSVKAGDRIAVLQPGGICVDTPPEVAAAYDPKVEYETSEDPMMQVGSTYLFFLEPFLGLREIKVPEPWGTTYSGGPFGRFLVGPDGRLQIVAKLWTCEVCLAPKALAGRTVAEAEATLRPVIARAAGAPTATPAPTAAPPLTGTPAPTLVPDTPQP